MQVNLTMRQILRVQNALEARINELKKHSEESAVLKDSLEEYKEIQKIFNDALYPNIPKGE
ncbi:hypothetical protein RE628_11240 [Paenibacillus sp. D2_2]|uniref:hypothetical protein n=1 Tax=Paenibacillus sp. D2_2 TaxID=3073092 RepID=UPI0028150BE9|nr:hypothetical protein [Paenibacillus sp. D2_2]WMT42801.1 hypothetical protein RE628_11240 [Paenibacillus sp. D2_2]